jgi:hypothetical protein
MSSNIPLSPPHRVSHSVFFFVFFLFFFPPRKTCKTHKTRRYLFVNSETKFKENAARRKAWGRLQVLNYVILTSRLAWVLVAVAVDWSSTDNKLLDLLDLFGLRYGLDTQLIEHERRVSTWSAGSGMVFDILLFGMMLVMSRMLLNGYTEEVSGHLREAENNSRSFTKVRATDRPTNNQREIKRC